MVPDASFVPIKDRFFADSGGNYVLKFRVGSLDRRVHARHMLEQVRFQTKGTPGRAADRFARIKVWGAFERTAPFC
jgi:hypothetical protein